MKCDSVRNLFEEFVDGETTADERALVEAHIAACVPCAAAVIALEREALVYRRYDREFEPSPDLWASIAHEITPPVEAPAPTLGERFAALLGAFGRFGWQATGWATAAVGVVMLGIGLFNSTSNEMGNVHGGMALVGWTTDEPISTVPNPIQPVVEAGPEKSSQTASFPARKPHAYRESKPTELSEIAQIDKRYQAAISQVSGEVSLQTRSLPDSDRKRLSEPIRQIDESIAAARNQAKADPNDPNAVLGLVSAYEKKLELLQDIATYRAVNFE